MGGSPSPSCSGGSAGAQPPPDGPDGKFYMFPYLAVCLSFHLSVGTVRCRVVRIDTARDDGEL